MVLTLPNTQLDDKIEHESDWHMHSLRDYVGIALSRLEDLPLTLSVRALAQLVVNYWAMAQAYYLRIRDLVGQAIPEASQRVFRRHQAVQRLAREWDQIMSVLLAADHSAYDPLLDLVSVCRAAQDNMNLSLAQQVIVPHFGRRHFEMVQFRYAPDVALLGLPMYNLTSPWEWSVAWHEVAGTLVGPRDPELPLNKEVAAYLAAVGLNGESGPGARPDEADFWQTWQQLYESLPNVSLDPRGWLAEWLEDACSLLALGPALYTTLETVLNQSYSNPHQPQDGRHPPPALRLEVAQGLLAKMGFDDFEPPQDPGTQHIAEWIWGRQEKGLLVKQLFSRDDRQAAERAAEFLLQQNGHDQARSALEQGLGGSDQEGRFIHRLVVAARRAFETNRMAGHHIWANAHTLLSGDATVQPTQPVTKLWQRQLAQAQTRTEALGPAWDDYPIEATESARNFIQAVQGTTAEEELQKLEKLELSWVDRGGATELPFEEQMHSHEGGDNTKAACFKISVTVDNAHMPHEFDIWLRHSHEGSTTIVTSCWKNKPLFCRHH